MKYKIVSLFSGCGGLDLGFEDSNKFKVIWANEFDQKIIPTYSLNFPRTTLTNSCITEIPTQNIPDSDGVIGGPPCQSWSIAGKQRGKNDPRGMLFDTFIEIVGVKKPKFFLAENVEGFMMTKYNPRYYLEKLAKLGYNVACWRFNASDFEVPQDRNRVFIVGYPESYNYFFKIEGSLYPKKSLKDAIWDLRKSAKSAIKSRKNGKNWAKANPNAINNHEYMKGDFSSHYMSRNRVRSWDEPSFTIQASGRHAPCHPQSKPFLPVERDKMKFDPASKTYRRLTVRESARIQTFPDTFKFVYSNLNDAYKMIGNSVPVEMAKKIAMQIDKDLKRFSNLPISFEKSGEFRMKSYKARANQTNPKTDLLSTLNA